MSIDADILSVLSEVGAPFTIYKPDGTTVSGEYLDPTPHVEHTTPAIRAYFVDFTIPHPTSVEVGDVVGYTGAEVIILALQPELFEGLPVDYVASGYRVNTTGSFQTYSQGAGFDSNYQRVKSWTDVYTGVRSSMMNRLFRSDMKGVGNDSVEVELDRLHLYVSDYYKIEHGMRWVTDSGDIYKVAQIESDRFIGINLVFLEEDTRSV